MNYYIFDETYVAEIYCDQEKQQWGNTTLFDLGSSVSA